MSSTSKTLLRLGVPTLAAATMIGGVPALLGTASAAHVTAITIAPATTSVPAGTCQTYTVNVSASTTSTIIDVLLDSPDSGVDAAFCTVTNGVATTQNGTAAGPDAREFTVNTTGGTGTFTFSAITAGNTVGTLRATAFAEAPNALGNGNNIPNADEFPAVSTTTVTAGGAQAAENLAVDERQDPAVAGEVVSYDVTVTNAGNQPLSGVTPEFDVTAGPDATLVGPGTDCTVSNQSGVAVCSYTASGGTGQNTVVFVVNQVNADGSTTTADTIGPDASEPTGNETTDVVAAQGNRSVVVTPLADTATADASFTEAADTTPVNDTRDGDRVFRAVIDATNADTATVGTRLAFAVTGGSGDETVVPRFATTTDNAATADTNDSAVEVTVDDPTPVSGEVLTVTATVRGTTQSGQGTYNFKNAATDARNITIAPLTTSTAPGTLRTFTATVVDSDGNPVEGVVVGFSETGAGAFRDGSSNASGVTNASGQATAEVVSLPTETGTQTVTATILTTGTQATQVAGAGTRPSGAAVASTQTAGNATATASNTFTTAAATTAPTATPTVSATPTGTVTPPAGTRCANPVGLTLNRQFVTPGVPVTATVTAPAGAVVEIQAYSRPSTTYRQARQATVGASGSISFDLLPGTNTRLFAACVAQTGSVSAQSVINVRTALSLTVVRNGTRNYTFQGRILPRRADQLITLYRVTNNGTRVLTSQLKTDSTGTYRINRRFTGSGTFGFLTRTGQTLTNAAGESNTPVTDAGRASGRGVARPTAIF